jgi:hypothetical protein
MLLRLSPGFGDLEHGMGVRQPVYVRGRAALRRGTPLTACPLVLVSPTPRDLLRERCCKHGYRTSASACSNALFSEERW